VGLGEQWPGSGLWFAAASLMLCLLMYWSHVTAAATPRLLACRYADWTAAQVQAAESSCVAVLYARWVAAAGGGVDSGPAGG